MYTITKIQAMVNHWHTQPKSNQRTTVLAYWVSQAQRFIKYSRTTVHGVRVNNTASEVAIATTLVTRHYGVPKRKKGEDRHDSMMRLTRLNENRSH